MQLHQIKPIHKGKKKVRVGRGGKRGTYSGRGMKGQKSRAGRNMEPLVRSLIKRYPKLRGYRFNPKDGRPLGVNIDILEKNFREGDIISPQSLLEKRLIRRINGRRPKVKILGKGKLTKKIIIESCNLSEAAKEAVEKAGGEIK